MNPQYHGQKLCLLRHHNSKVPTENQTGDISNANSFGLSLTNNGNVITRYTNEKNQVPEVQESHQSAIPKANGPPFEEECILAQFHT